MARRAQALTPPNDLAGPGWRDLPLDRKIQNVSHRKLSFLKTPCHHVMIKELSHADAVINDNAFVDRWNRPKDCVRESERGCFLYPDSLSRIVESVTPETLWLRVSSEAPGFRTGVSTVPDAHNPKLDWRFCHRCCTQFAEIRWCFLAIADHVLPGLQGLESKRPLVILQA